MSNDEDIKKEWERIENESIRKALEHLGSYEMDVRRHLAACVASLCNVDCDMMLTDTSKVYIAQSRWLYWFAYRYMTDETYKKIALHTKDDGYEFTLRAVAKGITKMSEMVESGIWKKRWVILKRIIKMFGETSVESSVKEKKTIRMVVYKPADVEVKIEFRTE